MNPELKIDLRFLPPEQKEELARRKAEKIGGDEELKPDAYTEFMRLAEEGKNV